MSHCVRGRLLRTQRSQPDRRKLQHFSENRRVRVTAKVGLVKARPCANKTAFEIAAPVQNEDPNWHGASTPITVRMEAGRNRRLTRSGLSCTRSAPPGKLRAHQQERVPSPPPVKAVANTRTVLVGKGSLRRARARPCRLRSVLVVEIRDGRLRREHIPKLGAEKTIDIHGPSHGSPNWGAKFIIAACGAIVLYAHAISGGAAWNRDRRESNAELPEKR